MPLSDAVSMVARVAHGDGAPMASWHHGRYAGPRGARLVEWTPCHASRAASPTSCDVLVRRIPFTSGSRALCEAVDRC